MVLAACASNPGLPTATLVQLPWQAAASDRATLLARNLIERGQGRAALVQLETVLAQNPRHVDAARLRQDVLRERGRLGRLYAEAAAGVAAAPDDGLQHYLLGRIVPEPAVKLAAFERAAALAPELVWPWLGLAHTLRNRDPERALAIYERLFAASDGHPLVGIAYGALLRERGRLDIATEVYRRLQNDARVPGVGDLGLAQIALAKDDRAAAFASTLATLRLRPFDAGSQGLALAWLESGLRDEQIAQLIDVLREEPQRLYAFAAGDGAAVAATLLERGGQPQAAARLLRELPTRAEQPVLRRQLRRLLLRLGDVRGGLDLLRSDLPLDVVTAEPNRLRSRWLSFLQGPWWQQDPLANGAAAAALLTALRDIGLLVEVELLAEAALLRLGADPAIAAVRDEVRAELAFEGGLRRLLYQGYANQTPMDLAAMLERVRELSLRVFGRDVVGKPALFSAPLVGEMLDPFAPGLAMHLDRYNKHLVLGRRAAGVVEGLLLTRLSVAELADDALLPLPARCYEVVAQDRDVTARGGVLGGDLAGVALLNHFLIDFDAVREWAGSLLTRRKIAREDQLALLSDPLPDGVGTAPLDAAWRLTLLSPLQDTELLAAVLDTIRQHERQHLVDAFYYLPVEHNALRGLGLLFGFGFSPAAIEGEMERRAELASLACSPHTELVLAHIADFLDSPNFQSPHHRGFGQLAAELNAELQVRGEPAEHCVPSRWHLLDRQKVVAAARALLGQLR
jgi:hypothetical protein